jgi:hypothetical protein
MLMASKGKALILVLTLILVVSSLVFFLYSPIAHAARNASDTHHQTTKPQLTCHGSTCDGKDPGQYPACKQNLTTIFTSTIGNGDANLTLFYNHNCDVWFGIMQLTNASKTELQGIGIHNKVTSWFLSRTTHSNISLMLFNGVSRTTVYLLGVGNMGITSSYSAVIHS